MKRTDLNGRGPAKVPSKAEKLRAEIGELQSGLRDALAMLDVSGFGGYKTYRSLTAFELVRLEEIRKLVEP